MGEILQRWRKCAGDGKNKIIHHDFPKRYNRFVEITPLPPPIWVSTPAGLKHLVEDLNSQSRVAVDTESNSLHAYREQVCLIQFSTPQKDYLVDSLALTDLGPLFPLFANPTIEKIFHAAEYDINCMHRDFGFTFDNLFDTVIAARILGHPVVGLGDLLTEYFNITVNKQYQKSNWGKRPLTEEQEDYARLDSHYLIPLRDNLEKELRDKDLYKLALEDFKRACQPSNGNGKTPRARWERISGHQDLTPRQLSILNELCLCREEIAERLNRPVFKVLSDELLLSLAKTAPDSTSDLTEAGLSKIQVERFGSKLIIAIRNGQSAAPVVRTRSKRPSDAMLTRLDLLKQWRKREAKKMKVESDVILPRPLLYAIAEQGARDLKKLSVIMKESPWRFQHFGVEIITALEPRSKPRGISVNG
jgi:ribonuclease D